METRLRDLFTSIGLLILRLGVGGYMLTHGWGKLQMVIAGDFDKMGDPIGIGKTLSLIMVVMAEFVCALLIMLGIGTRFAAVPLVFAMGVAAFVAHKADPWTMAEAYRLFAAGETKFPASKEPAILYLIPFLALAFTGGGIFSLDDVLWKQLKKRKSTT